jgi:hypothetical protein
MPGDAGLHLFHSLWRYPLLLKDSLMNVLGTVTAGAPNDDLPIFLVPLENCTRADAELLANLRRHGYLALRS